MKLTLATFVDRIRGFFSPGQENGLDLETVKRMARGIASTHPGEIGCAECFEQMDQFVDLTLEGKNAAEALPLVQDHLERCRDCREEYEALLEALRAVS